LLQAGAIHTSVTRGRAAGAGPARLAAPSGAFRLPSIVTPAHWILRTWGSFAGQAPITCLKSQACNGDFNDARVGNNTGRQIQHAPFETAAAARSNSGAAQRLGANYPNAGRTASFGNCASARQPPNFNVKPARPVPEAWSLEARAAIDDGRSLPAMLPKLMCKIPRPAANTQPCGALRAEACGSSA